MPNTKSVHGLRRIGSVEEKIGRHSGRGRPMVGKASSFHGRSMVESAEVVGRLWTPKTVPVPDLRRGIGERGDSKDEKPRMLTKLLLNVTIQGVVGAVHVVMKPESTVGDLIAMAVAQYVKEGRRPMLSTKDPALFDLHYSQFSLESLDRYEKLMNLGSRNFFLCLRRKMEDAEITILPGNHLSTSTSSCSNEAEKPEKAGFNWPKFMVPFTLMGRN